MTSLAFWIWLAFVIGWSVLRYPAMRRARKTRTARDRRDAADISLLVLCALGLFAMPLAWRFGGLFSSFDTSVGWARLLAGLIAGVFFLWLFRRSHKDLGRNWSVSLEVREGHALVTEGVYAHVRHPMYASFFLWGIMQALLIGNWIAGAAGFVAVGVLYVGRHGREEAMMREAFGTDYEAYSARTSRLLPGVY